MHASGSLVPFADGSGHTVSSPFEVVGVSKSPARIAPGLGEHSAQVLREAGYTEDDIARLRTDGVVS
jgi:formyl-CoA transferase